MLNFYKIVSSTLSSTIFQQEIKLDTLMNMVVSFLINKRHSQKFYKTYKNFTL